MITKGQAVYYKNAGGGIKVGFALSDEVNGTVELDFPGREPEKVPTASCFNSAREAHATSR